MCSGGGMKSKKKGPPFICEPIRENCWGFLASRHHQPVNDVAAAAAKQREKKKLIKKMLLHDEDQHGDKNTIFIYGSCSPHKLRLFVIQKKKPKKEHHFIYISFLLLPLRNPKMYRCLYNVLFGLYHKLFSMFYLV